MKKLFLGLAISIAFISVILLKFDFSQEFAKIEGRISYGYLIPIVITQLLGLVLFSVRWELLLENKIKLKHAVSSSFIGYAANMVLPARGGDLFRVYYCRAETDIQYFNLLSKLFIEKVVDFIFVIIFGITSYSILAYTDPNVSGSYTVFTISGLIILGIVVSLYLIRYQNEWVQFIGKKTFVILKKEEFYKDHIESHLTDLKEFLTIRKFIKPVLVTTITWAFYYMTYYFVNLMMGGETSALEIVFLLFCGAMSLALPSAPSGIGVFHASIISGFLLLGRDEHFGLLYATALHLLTFVIVTASGLVFYIYWTYRRRHGKIGKP